MTKWLKAAELYTHTHTHTCNSLLSLCATRLIFAILVVCAVIPAYATTDIQPNGNLSGGNTAANCTQPVLGTYSGSANFEAKWRANEVPIRWYDNNTQMQNLAAASNTCNYDGTLTIPATPPSRTGYNFAGWKVRPQFDFATLAPGGTNALSTALGRWAICLENSSNHCYYSPSGVNATHVECSDSAYSDLKLYEWKVQWSTGTLYGTSYCSAKYGDNNNFAFDTDPSNWKSTYDVLESTSGEKKKCWCQATGWKPSGNNANGTIYGQTSITASSIWIVDNYDYGSFYSCAGSCATRCASFAIQSSAFRRALFTGTASN